MRNLKKLMFNDENKLEIIGGSKICSAVPIRYPQIVTIEGNREVKEVISREAPDNADAYTSDYGMDIAIAHPVFGGEQVFCKAIAVQYYKIIK